MPYMPQQPQLPQQPRVTPTFNPRTNNYSGQGPSMPQVQTYSPQMASMGGGAAGAAAGGGGAGGLMGGIASALGGPVGTAIGAGLQGIGAGMDADQQRRLAQQQMRDQMQQFYVSNNRAFELGSRNAQMGEGAMAAQLGQQAASLPMRDQAAFALQARMGMTPQNFVGRDMFNPENGPASQGGIDLNQLGQQVSQYTPGAGGLMGQQGLLNAIIEQMGYSRNKDGGYGYVGAGGYNAEQDPITQGFRQNTQRALDSHNASQGGTRADWENSAKAQFLRQALGGKYGG